MHHFATTAFPRRWMTLPEVSERIGVRYKTIYKAVSKASALRSSWVKHEPYPSPDGPQRWLVDTEHELFRLYLQRWQRRRHKEEVKDTSSPNQPFDPFGESYEDADDEAAAQPYMVVEFEAPRFDITQSWPEFCHCLGLQGLIVYQNAVARQEGWQWSWRQESGSGYADATAAVIGALQHYFTVCEPFPEAMDEPLETPFEEEPEPKEAGARLSLLHRVFRWS